jgi:hypothetical protein
MVRQTEEKPRVLYRILSLNVVLGYSFPEDFLQAASALKVAVVR